MKVSEATPNLIVTFIGSTYTSSWFLDKLSWALVIQLLLWVFNDMSNLQDDVWLSLKMDNQDKVTASALWTVIQTHDNIANHASISLEYMKFLASNSSAGDVADASSVGDHGFLCAVYSQGVNMGYDKGRLCSYDRR
jgi:hypothetical protein